MRFQYVYVEPGLPSELSYITLDEVVKHLDNYLNNFCWIQMFVYVILIGCSMIKKSIAIKLPLIV